jgi:hypothetical protein
MISLRAPTIGARFVLGEIIRIGKFSTNDTNSYECGILNTEY